MEKDQFIFKKWDSDTDVLTISKDALLPQSHPDVAAHTPWAYSINTAKGFYFKQTEKISKNDMIELPNRKSIDLKYTEEIDSLYFTDAEGSRNLFRNVTVWAHYFFRDFMIVTLHETDQTILIDSRGEPFELSISGIKKYHVCSIKQEKREGYYVIEGSIIVRYRTNEEQSTFKEKTDANLESIFNKEFNRFSRTNANNNTKYLYLTVGNSKCGALVNQFIKQGMQYEIVPNVLIDDETINVRIPLEGENAARKDVQFLCAKYFNTYSIYNIPYDEIGAKLELSRIQKEKCKKTGILFSESFGSGHETISYFIINTFRSMFNTTDDYEVYKKVFAKIARLLTRGNGKLEKNCFSDLLLLHPADRGLNENYVSKNKKYINLLLSENKQPSWEKLCREDADCFIFSDPPLSMSNAYKRAYDCSRKRFKEEMSSYESEVIYQIAQNGGTISKWKSEATLFALVKKEYPDAIYQYHSRWLGLQSLDIFIPSLGLAIEYQGEQHYRPVEVFGGEEAFKNLVARDERKAMLCRKNNVVLIYWKYDEVISVNRLTKKICEATSHE